MKRGRALACAGALLLTSACVFASEQPFFTEQDAAAPFAEMARFVWREDGADEEQIVVYRRAGAAYEITQAGSDEPPLRALFVAVDETPEQDYIAQVELPESEGARVYAFLLPTAFGYRIVSAPRAIDEAPGAAAALQRHCTVRPNGECHLASAAALAGLYLEAIYPHFVAGAAVPSDYIDQTPPRDNRRTKRGK